MTDEDLILLVDHAMNALSLVTNAARRAKEEKLTRLSSDVYHGANRAWLELDAVKRRQL